MARKREIFELDASATLEQAANALFLASAMADKVNDTEAIMNVVAGWLELHDRLRGVEHDRPKAIGFTSGFQKEPEELADAESDLEVEVEDGSNES